MTLREWFTSVVSSVPIANTAETAVLTTTGVSTQVDGEPIGLDGSINITTGTGVTAVVVRVRRGNGVTGALVGLARTYTVAASTTVDIPVDATDTPGAVAGQQYTVSVSQTGGTGGGTANYGEVATRLGQ